MQSHEPKLWLAVLASVKEAERALRGRQAYWAGALGLISVFTLSEVQCCANHSCSLGLVPALQIRSLH